MEKIIEYFISGNLLTWFCEGHSFTYNMSVPEFKIYIRYSPFRDYVLKRLYHKDLENMIGV